MLVVVLIGTVCTGLAVFAITDQRQVEIADARAAVRFLARQSEPLLHWDDRVALQSLAAELVESRETLVYALVERDGRPLVYAGDAPAHDILLRLHPRVTTQPAMAPVTTEGRRALVDIAVQATQGDAAIHLGLSRHAVSRKAQPRLLRIMATGLAASLLGCALAWSVAATTTREVARAQLALQESEERFRCLFEQAPDSVFLLDCGDGSAPVILDANRAALRPYGGTAAELRGTPFFDVVRPSEQVSYQLVSGHPPPAGPLIFEGNQTGRDGGVWPVEIIAQETRIAGKTVIQAIGRDLSGRKRAEAERAKLEAQLHHTRRMEAIARLAGGVAHDVNNALGAIVGAVTLIGDDLPPEHPHQENVAKVLQACRRSDGLTSNLLGYAGKGKYVTESLSLGEIVREAVAELPASAEVEIAVDLNLADEGDLVQGDRAQIKQLVANLVQNALDSMPHGGELTVVTRLLRIGDPDCEAEGIPGPGRYVQLEVIDTGAGIEAEQVDLVFDPFFTTKPASQGAGLGLSMVMGVVRRLAGSVSLSSTPGVGSTARVLLPVVDDRSKAPPAVQTPPQDPQPGARCVLVVEDEALLRWAVRKHLEKSGFQVLEAADGNAALEVFERERGRISLVLLDMVMPQKGGRETFQDLRAQGSTAPVVLQSGFARDETIDGLLREGARAFIHKPFELDQLTAVIEEVLGATLDVTKR